MKETGLRGAIWAGFLGCSLAIAAVPDSDKLAQAQWGASIIHSEAPGEGCYRATYPSKLWESVPCGTAGAKAHPIPRLTNTGQPETTGNGNDYALVAPSGHLITQTTGRFPAVSGVTSEFTVGGINGAILGQNEYSLQLNTNANGRTSACSGGASTCTVWQQFLYSTGYESNGSAAVYIEYWLINYKASGAACPSGYNTYQKSCWKNSALASAPNVPITSLASLSLGGYAAMPGGGDTVTLLVGNQAYLMSAGGSVLQIGTVWNQSEFNVLGDTGAAEAVFNSGSAVTLDVAAQYGLTATPGCASYAGTTGETNNLNLGVCTGVGGSTPTIQFTESHGPAGMTTFNLPGIQHTVYVDRSGNLDDAMYNTVTNQWLASTVNLTGVTGSPSASIGSGLTSWIQSDGPHVAYVDNSGNLSQIWYTTASGNWSYQNLNGFTGGPSASLSSGLTSWVQSDGPHVVYVDKSGNLDQAFYNTAANHWYYNNLNALTGSPNVSLSSGLTSWVQSDGPHIAYVDNAGNLDQTYYGLSSGIWFYQNLNGFTGGPSAALSSGLTSWIQSDGPHVAYVDKNGNLNQTWYNIAWNHWYYNDLNSFTGSPSVSLTSGLTSWIQSDGVHISYADNNGDLDQTYYEFGSGGWYYQNLNAFTHGTGLSSTSQMVSFSLPYGPYVVYFDTYGYLDEAGYAISSNQWSFENLSGITGAPLASN